MLLNSFRKKFINICLWTLLLIPSVSYAGEKSARELYEKAMRKLHGQKVLGVLPAEDPDGAINLFEKILNEYPSSPYAPLAELGIAEAYMAKGDPYMAIEKYRDFIQRRKGHEKYPLALCKIAEVYESLISAIDRDLTPAINALHYLQKLKLENPFYTECGDLDAKIKKLRTLLARRELYVARFYFKKGYLLAAQKRVKTVLDEYGDTPASIEAQKFYRKIQKKLKKIKNQ